MRFRFESNEIWGVGWLQKIPQGWGLSPNPTKFRALDAKWNSSILIGISPPSKKSRSSRSKQKPPSKSGHLVSLGNLGVKNRISIIKISQFHAWYKAWSSGELSLVDTLCNVAYLWTQVTFFFVPPTHPPTRGASPMTSFSWGYSDYRRLTPFA